MINAVNSRITGYIEGFYGRLLDWPQRLRILEKMQRCGMSHYFYAPKEDKYHRLHWREPYDIAWRKNFNLFARHARDRGIKVVAGVAPGLDFNFAHLGTALGNSDLTAESDLNILLRKTRQLLNDGAAQVALLVDDIDDNFHLHCGDFNNEGEAHAELANFIANELDLALWVVPRIYADEIAIEAPEYLAAFCTRLNSRHSIVYCGTHIVAPEVSTVAISDSLNVQHEIIIWDNLYANDYCPRRLFLGAYTGRENAVSILLNPTGMVETDSLLLNIMYKTLAHSDPHHARCIAMQEFDVPDVFDSVATYFCMPGFSGQVDTGDVRFEQSQIDALDYLLWKWKSALSLEWYPYLMGLKQDLLVHSGQLPRERITKTQLSPLAACLKDDLAYS